MAVLVGRHCSKVVKIVAHEVAKDVTLTLIELVEMEMTKTK